jgi:predicted Zn-dependent protease
MKAGEFARRSIELARARESSEIAGRFQAERAVTLAVLGYCVNSKEDVAKALAISHARSVKSLGSWAAALCGEAEDVQTLMEELTTGWPNDTLLTNTWLPLMRAQLELRKGNSAQAVQQLQSARRYPPAGNFWPEYIRGQAYLAQSKGKEASVEFQTILDHRGWVPLSPLFPLAHLGLARAAVAQGDTATARKWYQDFFALWKDADSAVPILVKAKNEYEQLK